MRQIIFRGKRIDTKEWVSGHYYTNKYANKNDNIHHFISYGDHWGNYEVIPETVGQFTGLLDKNGNKIFEGDLLKIELFTKPHEVVFGGTDKWACSFCLKTDSSIIYLNRTFTDDAEIIGNIHQNFVE